MYSPKRKRDSKCFLKCKRKDIAASVLATLDGEDVSRKKRDPIDALD